MTLDQILSFVTVAETGSLTAASKALHKTQPAISTAIKKLETSLGLELMERQTYRLELTREGEMLLRHFRELLKQQKLVKSYASHLALGAERELHLVYESACGYPWIFDAVRRVKQEFPETEIIVTGEHRLGALKRLVKRQCQLVISPWLVTFRRFGDFQTTKLSTLRLVDVIHKDLLDFDPSKPVRQSQLTHIPQIMPQSFQLDLNSDAVITSSSFSRIRTGDLYSQKQLLLARAGWGLISEDMAREEIANGTLIPFSIEDLDGDVQVEAHCVRMADETPGPVAKRLWEVLGNKNI